MVVHYSRQPRMMLMIVACGIMSSENYEDWLWFLEKLKTIFRENEVVITSDRHPALF